MTSFHIIITALVCFTCITMEVQSGKLDRIKNAHPSDFLVSSDPDSPEQSKTPQLTSAEEEDAIRDSTHQMIDRLSSTGTDVNRPSVSYILDLFEKMENGEEMIPATSYADKEDAIAATGVIRGLAASVPSKSRHNAEATLSFPLSSFSDDETTELAELRLRPLRHHPLASEDDGARRQQRSDPARASKRGGIQRLRVSVLNKEGDRQVERIYKVKWRRDQRDGFTVLDITKVLRDMAASNVRQFQNSTLEISLRKTRSRKSRSRRDVRLHRIPSLIPENDAILVIYAKSRENLLEKEIEKHRNSTSGSFVGLQNRIHAQKKSERSRRALRAGKKGNRGRCSTKDLIIDFETLGWSNDIVFPLRYNAKTCSGKCPSPVSHSLNPTNHAILQSMMRLHDKSVKRPCCVPVSYKPLMMLYKRGDGGVEIRHHPNMVVDECGCR